MLKPDKIFYLSNWHKDYFLSVYPYLHRNNIIVTRNGLDIKYFAKEPHKEGNKLIYSSSPDRGLERLLELMPAIRARVPDVELSVYYGFENWKKITNAYGNQAERDRVTYFEKLLEEQTKQGLVKYHGRVPKQRLADAFLASKVLAYPTWFTETFGITAIEAQAGGCVPVSTHLAALPETVSHGFLIRPPSNTPEYAETFVRRVVSLLQDENERAKYAQAGREYTLATAGWDKVAAEWEGHFEDILKDKLEGPLALPAFGDY
jgi:glycosyltransferase involved in cell wall biosynthesis